MIPRKSLLAAALVAFVVACGEPDRTPTGVDGSRAVLAHRAAGDTTSPPDTTTPPDTLPPDTTAPPDTIPPDTIPPDTVGGRVFRVVVTPQFARVAVGDSVAFVATLFNRRGQPLSGREIRWRVSNPRVLIIESAFGPFAHVRALRRGSSFVTAISEGRRGSAIVVVR